MNLKIVNDITTMEKKIKSNDGGRGIYKTPERTAWISDIVPFPLLSTHCLSNGAAHIYVPGLPVHKGI